MAVDIHHLVMDRKKPNSIRPNQSHKKFQKSKEENALAYTFPVRTAVNTPFSVCTLDIYQIARGSPLQSFLQVIPQDFDRI